MAAESDLYTALSTDTPVSDVVGTRIYSDAPDQGVDAPFIFYERVSTEMITTIHSGMPIAEISQLAAVCYADTREDAESLGDKTVQALASAGFIYTGRQGEYDPETKLFAAAIEVQHNKSN